MTRFPILVDPTFSKIHHHNCEYTVGFVPVTFVQFIALQLFHVSLFAP